MKANISKDCTWRVENRYGTTWEEALDSERRGPENKEAYINRREQTGVRVHWIISCCSSSWASQRSQIGGTSSNQVHCSTLRGVLGARRWRARELESRRPGAWRAALQIPIGSVSGFLPG
eukprot:1153379-Pelagomonas_calceolata.AAC.11